ncbi:protein indeterminate-domain 12-like [Arachis stenosperma]|uniref:protein indeterminate-domain 12-like n=1 Tax=Arachis stenosperma TaxID=217475 RepID=UPI0025AD46BD|nr:protein indeterminate-domain 12-like [Arachis stenosperma]
MTSASSEISASTSLPIKKKRNLPGHPDPDAEVIALSPKSLLATNRFVCDVCNKGFQRDQNLQLHRRGHNLPWKLKQRSNKEIIRKKVYVCPEPTCVHHDPSRALGDLTGIKKHFCRKHGEKKWKCDRCSKRYAVHSDWKAHSKICGTREYKCDCGTIFSRRDSFIAHRAFCDALAQESTKAITTLLNPSSSVKKELQEVNFRSENVPSWLSYSTSVGGEGSHGRVVHNNNNNNNNPTLLFSSPPPSTSPLSTMIHHENPNPNITMLPPNNNALLFEGMASSYSSSSSHNLMSATALLQKASEIGATVSLGKPYLHAHHHHRGHVPESTTTGYGTLSSMATSSSSVSGLLDMDSREEIGTGMMFARHHHGFLASYDSHAKEASLLVHNDMMDGTSTFEEALMRGIMNHPTREDADNNNSNNFDELVSRSAGSRGGGGGVNDETRDFLGIGVFSQRDIFNISGLHHHHLDSSSYGNQNQKQPPWQG